MSEPKGALRSDGATACETQCLLGEAIIDLTVADSLAITAYLVLLFIRPPKSVILP